MGEEDFSGIDTTVQRIAAPSFHSIALKTCVPIGSAGFRILIGTSKRGVKPLRTNSLKLPKRYLQTQLSPKRGTVFLGCMTVAITDNKMNSAIVTAQKVIHMVFSLSVQRGPVLPGFSNWRAAPQGKKVPGDNFSIRYCASGSDTPRSQT